MTSSIMAASVCAPNRGSALRAYIGADQAKGSRRRVLDRADDDAALDVGDQAQRQNALAQEIVEGVHIARHDPQLIVGRAGDGRALHHLGKLGNRRLEGVEVVLGRQAELDGAIDLKPKTQLVAVEDRHAPLDDAGVFQALDTPPAGAGGQADPFRDLGDRQAGVVLDEVENFSIDGVQDLRHVLLPLMALYASFLPLNRPVRARFWQAIATILYDLPSSARGAEGRKLRCGTRK